MTHACYLLRSLNPRFRTRFYIGCTTDPRRRLRQHNGELGQGAHLTKAKRPWEMVLCVYGFSSHVNALKFEWAWQHPLISLAVREAAGKLPSLKGVPGMITLVCTMVTLPEWNSLPLRLQFMLSNLLPHRRGSPPLPPQMRLFVASMDTLPGKDTQHDNDDDDDDLSTCPDMLRETEQLGEDTTVSTITVQAEAVVVADLSLPAEVDKSLTSKTASPCPKAKGKKSRKGKTPQGRKGKRGGTLELSEDPVLAELQRMGSDSRMSFVAEEIGGTRWSELAEAAGGVACNGRRSEGEKLGFCEITVDLRNGSAGQGILSHGVSNCYSKISTSNDSHVSEASSMKMRDNEIARTSSTPQVERIDCDDVSVDLPYNKSISERILSFGVSMGHSRSSIADDSDMFATSKMQTTAKEKACKSWEEGIISVEVTTHPSEVQAFASDRNTVCGSTSRKVGVNETLCTTMSNLEESSLTFVLQEESPCRSTGDMFVDYVCLSPDYRSGCTAGEDRHRLSTSGIQLAAHEAASNCSHGDRIAVLEDRLLCQSSLEATTLDGIPKDQLCSSILNHGNTLASSATEMAGSELAHTQSDSHRGRIGSGEVSNDLSQSCIPSREVLQDRSHTSLVTGNNTHGATGLRVGPQEIVGRISSSLGERIGSYGEEVLTHGVSKDDFHWSVRASILEPREDSNIPTSKCRVVNGVQDIDSSDSEVEEITSEEFQPLETQKKAFAESVIHNAVGTACDSSVSFYGTGSERSTIQRGYPKVAGKKETEVVELHQKSLPNFFPVRKHAGLPVYRKARNGDVYKVLGDYSNIRNVLAEVGARDKSGNGQDWKSLDCEGVQDTVFISDDDDDDNEIHEISANEFQQTSLWTRPRAIKRKGGEHSLSNFR